MIEELAVGAIGSCRIHTPLTVLANTGRIKFKTDAVIGYLHNPLEIAQSINFLKGDLKVPPQLAHLMNVNAPDRLGFEDRFFKLFNNVDALVIEISSIRIIDYFGWQLQINRFREFVKPFGLAERQVGQLFQKDCDRDAVLAGLTSSPPELVIDLIKNGNFYELNGISLVSALSRLRNIIPMPVIFIGLVTKNFHGEHISQRKKIESSLRWISDDHEETFFIDPTNFVVKHDIRVSMLDLGHYQPEFEPIVANHFYDEIIRFANASNEVNRRASRRLQRDLNRAVLSG